MYFSQFDKVFLVSYVLCKFVTHFSAQHFQSEHFDCAKELSFRKSGGVFKEVAVADVDDVAVVFHDEGDVHADTDGEGGDDLEDEAAPAVVLHV